MTVTAIGLPVAKVEPILLKALLSDPFFVTKGPKSTGRELFNLPWLTQHLAHLPSFAAENVQATLLELTALTIIESLQSAQQIPESCWFAAAVRTTAALMHRLASLLPKAKVSSTAAYGVTRTGSKPWLLPGWPTAASKALPPIAQASPAPAACAYWAPSTPPEHSGQQQNAAGRKAMRRCIN